MRLPIDTTKLTITSAGIPIPENVFGTEAPRVDRTTGERVHSLTVLVVGPDGVGGVLRIKVSGEPTGISPATLLKLNGFTAQPYEFNGKSGTSYWAESVEAATATSPARAERAGS